MALLRLWNLELTLEPGTAKEVSESNAARGRMKFLLSADLSTLDIHIGSQNSLWKIDLDFKLKVTQAGDVLSIVQIVSSKINSFQLMFMPGPAITVTAAIRNGSLFLVPSKVIEKVFDFFPAAWNTLGGHLFPRGIQRTDLKLDLLLGFDCNGEFALLQYTKTNPAANYVLVNEDYIGTLDTIFRRRIEQKLLPSSIGVIERDHVAYGLINFLPSNGANGNFMYVNPYIMNGAASQDNLAAYQYALVNGVLQYDVLKAKWYWTNGGALMLNYDDQNGNPVVITGSKFLLVYRFGNNRANQASMGGNYQKINPGISIAPVNGDDSFPVTSINPRSINNALKNKQLYGGFKTLATPDDLTIASRPYWLSGDGRVRITGKAPYEFYGLSKGTLYKPKEKSLAARLQVSDILNETGQTIYHATSVHLDFDQMDVATLVEEKESFEIIGDNKKIASTRMYKPIDAGNVLPHRLPASNYKIAATNIFPKPDTHAIIPKGVGLWIDAMQAGISNLQSGNDQIKHETGFRRREGVNAVPKDFFEKAPRETNLLLDTAPTHLQFRKNEVPAGFVHGSDVGNDDPFLPRTFEHTALHLQAFNVQEAGNNIMQDLRKARRFWNECSSLATETPKAKAWQVAKYYFQKGPENFLKAGADMNKLFDIRDDLQQFLGKNTHEKIINDLRLIVNGNVNAVNGLGIRLKSIREKINKWDKTNLEEYWKKDWQAARQDAENKVIFELLNYYYYPFDRKSITEVAKLKAFLAKQATDLTAAEAQVRAAFNMLEVDFTSAFEEVKSILDNEIVDLDPAQAGNLEIKRLLTDAWIDVSSYVSQLELLWNFEIPEKINEVRTKLSDALTDSNLLWTEAEKKIIGALAMQDVWPVVRVEASAIWSDAANTLVQKRDKLYALYVDGFINNLKQVKYKFGQYFNPLAYKSVLDSLAKNGLTGELAFLKKALVKKVTDQLEHQLEEILVKDLSSYEEDILSLQRQVKNWSNTIDKNNAYLRAALSSGGANIKTTLNALRLNYREGFRAVQVAVMDIVNQAIGSTEDEVNRFVDGHLAEYEEARVFISKLMDGGWAISAVLTAFDEINDSFSSILTSLQGNVAAVSSLAKDYLLHKYRLNINLEDLRLHPPEYIVYGKNIAFTVDPSIVNDFNAVVEKLFASKFTLSSMGSNKWNMVQGETSIYILKLGNKSSIPEIMDDIEKNNVKAGGSNPFNWDKDEKEKYMESLLPVLKTKSWRGIFIFKPIADISKDRDLNQLLGLSHFKMPYAAIGGQDLTTQAGVKDLNVYARINDSKDPVKSAREKDVDFTIVSFDATIVNTSLVAGEVVTRLDVRTLLGRKLPENTTVIIVGTIPADRQETANKNQAFKFSARLERPLKLDVNIGFFKEITVSTIRASNQQDKCFLELDATLSFKEYAKSSGIDNISLKDFRIEIPAIPAGGSVKIGQPRMLDFDLQALEFLLSDPRPLNLLEMELLPTGLGFTKKYNPDDFKGYFWCIDGEPGKDKTVAYVKMNVEFGNLTSLGSTDNQVLKMSGILAYTVEGGDAAKLHFGISGGEFRNIDINLFRFIELKIKKLDILGDVQLKGTVPHSLASVIYAEDSELSLLNWKVFGENAKVSLMMLNEQGQTNSNRKGFYFLYKNSDPQGVLKIHWALISKGILIPPKVLTDLLTTIDGLPGSVANLPESGKINEAGADPRESFKDLAFTNDNAWLLGASFAIGNVFDRCSFILHDKHYYGIMLSSSQAWFKALFQTDRIALAYIPGRTKKEDRFRLEMKLPALDLIGALKSGMCAVEVGINRDFLIDLGYPWRVGNRYEWDRAFSSIQGIYELKLGVYFEKRTEYSADDSSIVTIGAGIGIYYGYHVGGSTPIAWAEAGIGLFVILAGQAKFRMSGGALNVLNSSVEQIDVIGVIGIYAYAQGGVNYWVISASFRAEIQAAIAGHLLYLPHGESSLLYEAMLSARFSASARVKLGFIRITVSISGSVEIHVGGKIAL